MFRSQAVRLARPVASRLRQTPTSRAYATTPPPPAGQPAPNPVAANKGSSNTILYAALGTAGLGAAYYYFIAPDDAEALKRKAEADEREIRQRAQQTVEAAKARGDDAYRQTQLKYDETKAAGREKYDAARDHVDKSINDTEARARGLAETAEAKYDSYKNQVKDSVAHARDSTENLYNEARTNTERKASELKAEADRKAQEAKQSWFSWFGWGKSKVDEGEHKVTSTLEEEKRAGAREVAKTAGDVKDRAEKHT